MAVIGLHETERMELFSQPRNLYNLHFSNQSACPIYMQLFTPRKH